MSSVPGHFLRDRRLLALGLGTALTLLGNACSEPSGPGAGLGGSSGSAGRSGAGGGVAAGGSGRTGVGGTSSTGGTPAMGGSSTGSAGTTMDAGDRDPPPAANARYAYVGSSDDAIYVFAIDDASGVLTALGAAVAADPNPSFLAVTPDGRYLLAVNESDDVGGTGSGAVSSFGINPATGAIAFINRVSSQGAGPAHVSTDRSGRFVFVANYNGGTVAVLPLDANGTLSPAVETVSHGGGAQSHQALVDQTNHFLFVPNKGQSNISQYLFDDETGALTANMTPALALSGGAGTRHLAFHPSAAFAYAINELDDTVVTLAFNTTAGTLTAVQTLSSLPAGANAGNNTGAEIIVAPSGNFVYASNRGDDSIAIFSVDPATRQLSLLRHQPSGGDTPRSFTIEASGRRMLVANQDSDEVVSFSVDPTTGLLTERGSVTVPSPAFVGTYPPSGD